MSRATTTPCAGSAMHAHAFQGPMRSLIFPLALVLSSFALPAASASDPLACAPSSLVCVEQEPGRICLVYRTGDLEDPHRTCVARPNGVPDYDVCTPLWGAPIPHVQVCASRDNTWYCYSARIEQKYLADECFQFIGP